MASLWIYNLRKVVALRMGRLKCRGAKVPKVSYLTLALVFSRVLITVDRRNGIPMTAHLMKYSVPDCGILTTFHKVLEWNTYES